ncbi:chromosome segregation protein SMC [Prochlorococcus marinus]|uniref:chromosome segregation protein SMC n=1 Tax=Prochlorococcus marinus TaxID=1219 RepID=UPI0022B5C735|nr:chromosome segregation protein SMC [Prochlorococcus marinus]
MVHINHVDLSHFKSFGGSMSIPLEEGFTVVTGPNGSGKSNILDGVLFCLGLANSRGMRADRLPDLVNSGVLKAGRSSETKVTVKFDLTDWVPDEAEDGIEPTEEGPWIKPGQKEWTVSRRLKVMPGGSYSSSYYADGETCNLQQLQTQLRRLRIDPEGSNVVMQGDVTRIVSMSNKDRRGLIDELAGVALFDTRIDQTRSKLDDVYERQERCRIVEQELILGKQRLQKDCEKASLYKDLKNQLLIGRQQELVLTYEDAKCGLEKLDIDHQELIKKEKIDSENLINNENNLKKSIEKLDILQKNVKELGEDQLLAVQAKLAGIESQSRELERQGLNHKNEGKKLQEYRNNLLQKKKDYKTELQDRFNDIDPKDLEEADLKCKEAEAWVESSRRKLSDVAGRSGAWMEKHQKARSEITEIRLKLDPKKLEKQNIEEDLLQLNVILKELESDQEADQSANKKVHLEINNLNKEWDKVVDSISIKKEEFQELISEKGIQERTKYRLEKEEAKLQNDIARLESRKEMIYESRGTNALSLLLESGLDGIHGPVANLGEVEDRYRIALEVAAGARLGQIVVDNDRIAAQAIDLLKRKRAGRLTFLPLNKILKNVQNKSDAFERPVFNNPNTKSGLIGKAINLIQFDSIYKYVFLYVFGETVVFSNLSSARDQIGIKRAVTLDGELLDKSGAMTGGSLNNRSLGLNFGRLKDNDDSDLLKNRLLQIGETLVNCQKKEKELINNLDKLRTQLGTLEQKKAALDAERLTSKRSNSPLLDRQSIRAKRIGDLQKSKKQKVLQLESINIYIKPLEVHLLEIEREDKAIDNSNDSSLWAKLQNELENADRNLLSLRKKRDEISSKQSQNKLAIDRLNDQENSLIDEENRLKDSIESLATAHIAWREQNKLLNNNRQDLLNEQKDLETRFGEQRRERDFVEAEVSKKRLQLQELQWSLQRLRDNQKNMKEEMRMEAIRCSELEKKLPYPMPVISAEIRDNGLESLLSSLEGLQKRMEELEPVNMLALEELAKLDERLNELENRLQVLTDERSELLLRIETVSTLRQEAFMEAFKAVDVHFREIFASLSEGDGHLQLENPDQPLEGGLTLVAHPKGKPVRRLAAMSGGEKSLTALSFLFALQRFRPSPFYALDEVDSFLDGVNVERLAALIAQQAQHAQFLVVSHRRPMIGASLRTIGVTQARGNHTQVVGLPIAA